MEERIQTPYYYGTVPYGTSATRSRKGGSVSPSVKVFSGILGVFLGLLLTLFSVLLFFYTVSDAFDRQLLTTPSAENTWDFLTSGFSLLLFAILSVIFLLLILFVNRRALHKSLLFLGIAFASAGVLCAAVSLFGVVDLNLLPIDVRDITASATSVFENYCFIFSMAFLLAAAIFVSLYLTISCVKRRA